MSQPGIAGAPLPTPKPSDLSSSEEIVQVFPSWGLWREQSFTLRVPSVSELAISANRLLKFKFPVFRNLQAYERLLSRQLQPPKLSKKALESLPVPVLEALNQQIWRLVLPTSDPNPDLLLTLVLLVEEMRAYRIQEWVAQDIQLLGSQGTGHLHSYFFSEPGALETYETLLEAHGYRTDFLQFTFPKHYGSQEALGIGYLLCRALTYPLPWSALLAELDAETLEAFPLLGRLSAVHQFFQAEGHYTRWTVTPNTVSEIMTDLYALVETSWKAFSKENQVACPVREVVMVEGATEELLLPHFARSMGIDFCEEGIYLQAAGGKNQVPALYLKASELLAVPIFMVLDRDAEAIYEELRPILRPQDRVFLFEEGEIEDTYDLDLILKTINEHYHPHPRVTRQAFNPPEEAENGELGRVEALKLIWKAFNLGDFDKTHFATKLSESFTPPFQLTTSMRQLIEAILERRNAPLAP